MDEETVRKAGVLDTKNLGLVQERSWIFRTVGYGHDETTWKNIISQLKTIGYDGTISIEHEDALMSVKEGAEKSNRISEKRLLSGNRTVGHGGLKEAKKERGDIMPAGTSYLFKVGMLSDSIYKKVDEKESAYYEIGVKNQFLHAVHPIGWFKKAGSRD